MYEELLARMGPGEVLPLPDPNLLVQRTAEFYILLHRPSGAMRYYSNPSDVVRATGTRRYERKRDEAPSASKMEE